ncbi:hypothetical protein XAB3213_3770034 [Xanthomonas citri pv. bilvae]|nr:hypothetical protein XAB3213_3770034 [Xanthomonas citri pv. bilvae]
MATWMPPTVPQGRLHGVSRERRGTAHPPRQAFDLGHLRTYKRRYEIPLPHTGAEQPGGLSVPRPASPNIERPPPAGRCLGDSRVGGRIHGVC